MNQKDSRGPGFKGSSEIISETLDNYFLERIDAFKDRHH